MRYYALILCLLLTIYGCKSSKSKSSSSHRVERKSNAGGSALTENIIDYAKQFDGVRYKYGGTTKSGMDCSGLIYTSFKAYNVDLPRVSRDMATRGVKVRVNEVAEGDLLFFETNPRKRGISHVGLVIKSSNGKIEFIHATTRAGVIVSNLDERYWQTAFVMARRVL